MVRDCHKTYIVLLLPWGRRCARAECPGPRLLNATESEEVIQHRIACVENYRKVSRGFASLMYKENFSSIQHQWNANQQVIYPRTVISAKNINGLLVRDGCVLGPPGTDKLCAFRHFPPPVNCFEWAEVERQATVQGGLGRSRVGVVRSGILGRGRRCHFDERIRYYYEEIRVNAGLFWWIFSSYFSSGA